jgi:hypothetical protein
VSDDDNRGNSGTHLGTEVSKGTRRSRYDDFWSVRQCQPTGRTR